MSISPIVEHAAAPEIKLTAYVDSKLDQELRRLARASERSFSAEVRYALRRHVALANERRLRSAAQVAE